MDGKDFGKAIRMLRKARGYTLDQLGEKIGYSNPYLSQIENGKKGMPSNTFLAKLAKGFDMDYPTLINKVGILSKLDENSKNTADIVANLDKYVIQSKGSDSHLDYILSESNVYYNNELLSDEEKKELLNFIDYLFTKRNNEK